MGFLRRALERRRATRVARLMTRGDPAAEAALKQLPPALRSEALVQVASELAGDGHVSPALERLEQALSLAPSAEALRLKGALLLEHDPPRAVEVLGRLLELAPEEAVLLMLADALIAADRPEEAISLLDPRRDDGPLVLLRLGKALYAAERSEEALEVVDAAMAQADALARSDLFGADITAGDPHFIELRALHEELLAEVHGSEAVVVDAAVRLKLDPRAGVNFKLLAKSLMHGSAAEPLSLELASPREQRREGERRVAERPEDFAGHLLLGSADLREGRLQPAAGHFERARELAPSHFAPVLGWGAARQLDEQRAVAAANRLPEPRDLSAWLRVVPDLPALSALELRVVAASVRPLSGLREHLERAGARIRVLPLDVRPTDLPELAHLEGAREDDDHRSWDTIEGLAGEKLAVAKVEALLDLQSMAPWVFAHELAHLALLHGPASLRAEVEQLHARFLEAEFVGTEYQLKNADELFACGYADFLSDRHGLGERAPRDDLGLTDALFELCARLSEPLPTR